MGWAPPVLFSAFWRGFAAQTKVWKAEIPHGRHFFPPAPGRWRAWRLNAQSAGAPAAVANAAPGSARGSCVAGFGLPGGSEVQAASWHQVVAQCWGQQSFRDTPGGQSIRNELTQSETTENHGASSPGPLVGPAAAPGQIAKAVSADLWMAITSAPGGPIAIRRYRLSRLDAGF